MARVKAQLLAEGLELEEFGGTVQLVETAATAGIGLTELEEALLLQVQAMGGNCLLVIPLTINIISAQLIVILMTEFFK